MSVPKVGPKVNPKEHHITQIIPDKKSSTTTEKIAQKSLPKYQIKKSEVLETFEKLMELILKKIYNSQIVSIFD